MYNIHTRPYTEKIISSKFLEVPTESYQRPGSDERAALIAANFEPKLLNDPKVSHRDGHYYVFDGQNTLSALRIMHDTEDFPVRCRLFEGMTEEEEARLFALQFGFSAPVPAGYRLRAQILAKDPIALAFRDTVESTGLMLGYSQKPSDDHIGCIKKAMKYFQLLGPQLFAEALSIMKDAWNGEAESLKSENLAGVCSFIHLYRTEYDRARLVQRLRLAGASYIPQQGGMIGSARPGDSKYLEQVWLIYNGTSTKHALPMKF